METSPGASSTPRRSRKRATVVVVSAMIAVLCIVYWKNIFFVLCARAVNHHALEESLGGIELGPVTHKSSESQITVRFGVNDRPRVNSGYGIWATRLSIIQGAILVKVYIGFALFGFAADETFDVLNPTVRPRLAAGEYEVYLVEPDGTKIRLQQLTVP